MLMRQLTGLIKAPFFAGIAVLAIGSTTVGADLEEAPWTEGKILYEETAGDAGCAMCHGLDATGDPDVGAPYIRGVTKAQLDAALDGGCQTWVFSA